MSEQNWECKKCKLLIQKDGRPSGYCSESNSGNHDWQKL
jgi:RNA polymerase subunit RPABC4/transcription elongation factor Spt4